MPVDHLGAATWCSSALIQSGHNWFEANGISFLGELLYTGNNQEVCQFYFSTLQSSATVYDITAFFSNYMGGLIYVGLKIWPIPCMYTLWMTLGQVNMQGITYRHYRVSCTQAGCRWLLWLAKYGSWGLLSSTSSTILVATGHITATLLQIRLRISTVGNRDIPVYYLEVPLPVLGDLGAYLIHGPHNRQTHIHRQT